MEVNVSMIKCKHLRTRKLFWMNNNKSKWVKTEFSICIDCWNIIKKEVKDVETI